MEQVIEELRQNGHDELADQLQPGPLMDPRLYDAARSGDTGILLELVAEDLNLLHGEIPVVWETAIHIALRCEHIDFAKEFCQRRPAMLLRQNSRGSTPLHCALRYGTDQFPFFRQGVDVLLSQPYLQDLWDANLGGMILSCISANESLLYVAADVNSLEAVRLLLPTPLGRNATGPNGWNALNAAIFRRNKGIVSQVLQHQPKLGEEIDNSANVPLHYAVYLDDWWIMEILVGSCLSTAYHINGGGLSPVHVAASMDRFKIFDYMLREHPESILMKDGRGNNVLHLAVKGKASLVVRSILSAHEGKDLMNERDENGNTPLHLATINRSSGIVEELCRDSRVDNRVRNNEGLTAMDIDGKYKQSKITEEVNILGARALPALQDIGGKPWWELLYDETEAKVSKEKVVRSLKDFASSMSVVATLITTVTFAAAFTMPGGYINDGPNKGMPLLKKVAFKAFLISDTISMCTSIITAFHLIWVGWYTSPYTLGQVIKISRIMMLVAVVSMGVAFATGVYVVIASKCLWLAVLIVVITCFLPFPMIGLGFYTQLKNPKWREKYPSSTIYDSLDSLIDLFQ